MRKRRELNAMVLRIPSRYVFSLPTALLSRSERKREADRNYCIEQFVPLNAEEFTSQIIEGNDQGLVIAVTLEPVNDLMNKLEWEGKWVGAVVPEFLLALQSLQRKQRLEADHEIYLQEASDIWNFGLVHDGLLVRWEWISFHEVVSRLSETLPLPLKRYVVASDVIEVGSDAPSFEFLPFSQTQLADEEEIQVLQGRSVPIVDFRGAKVPAKNPLRAMVLPATIFLYSTIIALSIASVYFFEGARLVNEIASSCRQEQEDLFRTAFPNSRIPVDIPSRFRSEAKKAEVSGLQAEKAPKLESVTVVLNYFLRAVPDKGAYRFDTLRIDGSTISRCNGIAESLADFETLLKSFRANDFVFPNPSLNQLGDSHYGFQFDSMQKGTSQVTQ